MPLAVKHYGSGVAICALAALLVAVCANSAQAQAAPGNLPWGVSPGSIPTPTTSKNDSGNALSPVTDFITGELFQHAYGSTWFEFDSLGTSGYGHMNTTDVGFSLSSSGFVLDPRLWTQVVSLNLDHFSETGTGSQNLGFFLNGTLLRKRSFPLRVTVVRRAADGNSLNFQNHDSHHALILDWTLRQPKFANVSLAATFEGTARNTNSESLPTLGSTTENARNLDGIISRSFWGWTVSGSAFDHHMRGTSDTLGQFGDYRLISRGGSAAVQRSMHLGNKGELRTTVIRQETHTSGFSNGLTTFGAPALNLAFTNARTLLTYRHTEKLRGSYGAEYLSNVSQQAITTHFQSSAGIASLSPAELNPGVRQALSSPTTNSSISAHGDWSYRMTDALTLGLGVRDTTLSLPQESFVSNQSPVDSYATLIGSVAYSRDIDNWQTNWHAGMSRNWDQVQQGNGFVEDSRTVGLGVGRTIGRWKWKSDLSYSDYLPRRLGLMRNHEERWSNLLQTRIHEGASLDLSADLVRSNASIAYALTSLPLRGQGNGNTMLLTRAALHVRRWDVSGGTGLRYLNMRNLTEVNDPLLIPVATTADRFTNFDVIFKMKSNLSFYSEYRRDNLHDSTGYDILYSGLQFSVSYRLGKLIADSGFERQNQAISGHAFNYDRVYVRLRRPFRLY